jgi:putative hydrolase of the HAD superfamily
MPPPVRAVLFDAVGTLILPEPSVGAVYAEIGRRHGSRLDTAAAAGHFRAAFAHQEAIDSDAGWRTDERRERGRWEAVVAAVLDDVPRPEACFAELWEHFAHPSAWRPVPGAVAVVADLMAQGLVVGVASNFDARLHTVLAGLSGLTGVRPVLASSEVGWRKPSPAFFAAACAAVGCAAGEVLLVGDDVENDVLGGGGAGLRTVLYDPRGRHADVSGRITDLAEVARLVG